MVSQTQVSTADLPIDSGVKREDRKNLAELMGGVLASSYVLYHKTHAFHWNIVGPLFYSVHKLTDEQYRDMASAIDEIAERVRAIGYPAPCGLGRYIEVSVVKDETGLDDPAAMIRQLAKDHQALAEQLRSAVSEAESAEDVYTADLLTARIGAHDEASWMLNALVQ